MTRPSRARLLLGSSCLAVVIAVVAGAAISAPRAAHDSGDEVLLDRAANAEPSDTNRPLDRAPLPAVELHRLDGTAVNTTDLLGTPLIINIWYSTCLPCKRELPDLARVQRKVGDRVRFIGVDIFPASQTEESLARDRGVNYELFYDPDGNLTSMLGITTAPTTLFVDADGTVIEETGVLTAERLRQVIAEVFG